MLSKLANNASNASKLYSSRLDLLNYFSPLNNAFWLPGLVLHSLPFIFEETWSRDLRNKGI